MYYVAHIAHLCMHVNYGITFCPQLKRICVANNNSFRFLHGLSRYVSARKQQVLNNITTFDAILRKMSCSFVYRCY